MDTLAYASFDHPMHGAAREAWDRSGAGASWYDLDENARTIIVLFAQSLIGNMPKVWLSEASIREAVEKGWSLGEISAVATPSQTIPVGPPVPPVIGLDVGPGEGWGFLDDAPQASVERFRDWVGRSPVPDSAERFVHAAWEAGRRDVASLLRGSLQTVHPSALGTHLAEDTTAEPLSPEQHLAIACNPSTVRLSIDDLALGALSGV